MPQYDMVPEGATVGWGGLEERDEAALARRHMRLGAFGARGRPRVDGRARSPPLIAHLFFLRLVEADEACGRRESERPRASACL